MIYFFLAVATTIGDVRGRFSVVVVVAHLRYYFWLLMNFDGFWLTPTYALCLDLLGGRRHHHTHSHTLLGHVDRYRAATTCRIVRCPTNVVSYTPSLPMTVCLR